MIGSRADLRHIFDPDLITTMQTALDAAWNVLRCSDSELAQDDRQSSTRLMLAQRIISRAQSGETSYGRLLMVALDGLVNGSDSAASGVEQIGA